jgi:hypothetical protein
MLLWLITSPIGAQNYYTPGTTIRGNGFTYICDVEPGSPEFLSFGDTRVRNANNTLTNQPPLRNGQPVSIVDNTPVIIGGYDDELAVMCNAVSEVMTAQDRQNAINEILKINMRVNPQTGKIMEIEFVMDPDKNGFIRIAPEKLYHLEKVLKEKTVYQISAVGKTQNFVSTFTLFRGRDIGATYNFSTKTWTYPRFGQPLEEDPGSSGGDDTPGNPYNPPKDPGHPKDPPKTPESPRLNSATSRPE